MYKIVADMVQRSNISHIKTVNYAKWLEGQNLRRLNNILGMINNLIVYLLLSNLKCFFFFHLYCKVNTYPICKQ